MKKILFFYMLFYGFTNHATPDQYAIEAHKKPIAFAVVREDSSQDLEIIQRFFAEDKISMLMVASGGCTAALLAAKAHLNDLTLVDPNNAQLSLTKLKIHLLNLPTTKRLEILGYLPIAQEKRKKIIQGYMQVLDIDENTFGSLDEAARVGLDFIGRYENVFEEIRYRMSTYAENIKDIFAFNNIQEQAACLAPGTVLGSLLDTTLDKVMSQENLIALFGEKATANRVQDFSRHFAQQMRLYTSQHLASASPWLAQMLLGNFYNDNRFPWLEAHQTGPLPEITYVHGFMNDALQASQPEQYHVIHLSNIIDWLTPQEAEETLALAYKALKPGGIVTIRQLNSTIDIAALNSDLVWDAKTAREFLQNDHSFFYRNFFIGIKPAPSLAPQVKALADQFLKETPIIEGSFFKDLPTMDKEVFKKAQSQFFFAVDYFSRPMAALVARLPLHSDRIDIIENIVEEHGNFCKEKYHANSFKAFLQTLGKTKEELDVLSPSAVVNMFNYTLMGICAQEDPLIAIACNGIIEYAFSDISALLAEKVVERKWVTKDKLVHYNLHADLDKKHAEEFFKIIEPSMDDKEKQDKIIIGLKLGVYIFNRLYEDLYTESKW